MSTAQIGYFLQLKKSVEKTFQSRHANCSYSIEDWKGGDIRAFQTDLQETVGGYISEKWFYTHIKTSENEKLPRIDMLNMLATYIGFENWESFVEQLKPNLEQVITEKKESVDRGAQQNRISFINKRWTVAFLGAVLVGCLSFLIFPLVSNTLISSDKRGQKLFNFCFVDADTQEPIQAMISVTVLQKEETELHFLADSIACIQINHIENKIRLVVSAPYYRVDTIERSLTFEDVPETILLRKDDYALMLHYFSTQNMEDWKKRRRQLDEMIAADAQIVQIMESDVYEETGIELFTKDEFINKMTMPLNSLKNIEIIKTVYEEGRMVQIRFKQNEE